MEIEFSCTCTFIPYDRNILSKKIFVDTHKLLNLHEFLTHDIQYNYSAHAIIRYIHMCKSAHTQACTCSAVHIYYAATERLCMVIPHTCLSEEVLDISSSLFSPAPGGGWQWWTKCRMMSTSGVAEMASSNDYSSKNYTSRKQINVM